jgi:7-cyano-7-deazaguanine reductase
MTTPSDEPTTILNQNYLGTTGSTEFNGLDTFDVEHLTMLNAVTFETDEFTSVCPVTGQPDYATVIINYRPIAFAVESKSLKLFLMTFRNKGHFAEALADIICRTIHDAVLPEYVKVTIKQKPRGGVALDAVAEWY